MITDEQLDAELRSLTRSLVASSPLPPELDIEDLCESRWPKPSASGAFLLLIVVALATVALTVGSRDRTSVQAGGDLVPLDLVQLSDGRKVLRTPGIPELTASADGNAVRCLARVPERPDFCVADSHAGIQAVVADIAATKVLVASVPHTTVAVEVEAGELFLRQQPMNGFAVLALPHEVTNATSNELELTAYGEDGEIIASLMVDVG